MSTSQPPAAPGATTAWDLARDRPDGVLGRGLAVAAESGTLSDVFVGSPVLPSAEVGDD